mgnify:CR=1 FL=1
MKQLLLVSYYFPPQPEAGALRPGFLAKYLPEFGWEVAVVTSQHGVNHSQTNVVAGRDPKLLPSLLSPSGRTQFLKRVPGAKRSVTLLRSVVYFPDEHIGWLLEALKLASTTASKVRFHAVLSTFGPPTAHIAGSVIAQRLALPWVADYRDPWSYSEYGGKGPVRRSLEYILERRFLKRARILTCVSEFVARKLERTHGQRDIRIIPNASDLAEWDNIPDGRPATFTFCFAGRLYGGQRNPDMLFSAVQDLRGRGDVAGQAIRFEFYGPDAEVALASARRYDLTDIVRTFGTVPRAAILTAERNSAVLLALLKMDMRTASEAGSKLLEFVGARRPVLVVGPNTSIARDLMDASGLGYFASNKEECMSAIRQLFQRFSTGQFDIELKSGWQPFTSRDLAREFAELLNEIAPD